MSANQDLYQSKEGKDQIPQKQPIEAFKAMGEEKPLLRSRSEQDLSDLIKKSKLSDEK
jgi:hypothetical protein